MLEIIQVLIRSEHHIVVCKLVVLCLVVVEDG
jgi:hypothetical protein